jgi:hypothetical protein
MSRALLLLGAVGTAALLVLTCQGLPDGATCDDIPDGGCPIDRGGSCDDPTCGAIYLCNNGVWSVGQICPPNDGGGPGGGGVGGGTTVPEGGPICSHDGGGACTPVVIDAGSTASDCTPDLACGDCEVSAAYGCAECACATGCLDFYVCRPDGWHSVAYCTDNGTLVISNQ